MVDKLLVVDEALEYLRLSKPTLYKLIKKGKLPASKVGHQWRFDKDELKGWLKRSRR